MAGTGAKVDDVLGAEAVAEAVYQMGRVLFHSAVAVEGALNGEQGIGGGGGQGYGLDPETDVEGAQLLGKQAFQVVHLADRTAGADGGARGGAIDPIENQFQPPCPFGCLFQAGAQLGEQAVESGRDVVHPPDRLGEGKADARCFYRTARRDCLVRPPQGLVQAPQGGSAETGGERCPRHGGEVGDTVKADPAQGLDHGRREAQSGHRQRRQDALRLLRWDDGRGTGVGEASHGPGRARRVGDRRPDIKTESAEAQGKIAEERRLAAKEMGATADVQP